MTFRTCLINTIRVLLTLSLVVLAIFSGNWLWQHYELAPWTRDGRVKANIIQIAPDITGQVTALPIHDNQQVKKGQLLFEIDRARYELAVRQAQAVVKAAQIAVNQANKDVQRNQALHELVAQESREQGESHLDQAKAALEQAMVNLDTARLNLSRTRVVSSADGTITNLDLRAGSYVSAGRPVMAEIENNSFYVEAYFEETKLPLIRLSDPVSVSLMGINTELHGQVESIAEGIVDRDRSTGSNLLPNINPTFNWVRLAQRIPVRIKLETVPANIKLVAGQTATVAVVGRRT